MKHKPIHEPFTDQNIENVSLMCLIQIGKSCFYRFILTYRHIHGEFINIFFLHRMVWQYTHA